VIANRVLKKKIPSSIGGKGG